MNQETWVLVLILHFPSCVNKVTNIYWPLFWLSGVSLMVQWVKNPPTMHETQFWSLGHKDPWRRKWQPTRVFLPGKFHGQKSLEGYSSWGHKESDITERLTISHTFSLRLGNISQETQNSTQLVKHLKVQRKIYTMVCGWMYNKNVTCC